MKNNVEIARKYYEALGRKDVEAMGQYLDPNIVWLSPLGEMQGKETVLESARKFVNFFNSIDILTALGEGEQVMLALNLQCPFGPFKTAVKAVVSKGLIKESDLYYDSRPFESKKEDIIK